MHKLLAQQIQEEIVLLQQAEAQAKGYSGPREHSTFPSVWNTTMLMTTLHGLLDGYATCGWWPSATQRIPQKSSEAYGSSLRVQSRLP
jgi:hypothetical protein